ncbi:MAG TPA: carboxy terminal-processing peptidase [Woeseiaceae bacterium]|nr:carboxy terminal-processing peptidase [Woeseiaceae bacterium]
MKQTESGVRRKVLAILLGMLALPALAATPSTADPELAPLPKHERIGELVTEFVEKSHYQHASVDDALSEQILKRYIEALDGNHMYLLKSDVEAFQKYNHRLDDMVRSESLEPVFQMFEVYRTRARERLNYALKVLETKPDFTVDEEYVFDREELGWADTTAQLDELWRKRVKNDALSLVLAEKEWPEVQETLHKRYSRFLKRMDQIKSDDVFETFMNAFAHTLDPHSSYLSPRSSEEYRIAMSLSYFGIGASLQLEDDYVKVVEVIPGGPADIDGRLQPDDRITAVAQGADGELVDVIGWRLDDVVQLIRGPAETVVQLQILPGGALPGSAPKTISLTRNQVKLEEQAAQSDIVTVPKDGRDWKIGVIEVPSFYRDYRALSNGDENYTSTTRDVKRLIAELEQKGIDGLIIDLRDNGGGHLTEATALSGLFIDNGPVVQLKGANGRITRLDDPDPVERVYYSGPLAVLVNRYSASASEIFAAAIQDYERGIIIGQRTFGKGTVQNLYSLDQYVRSPEGEGLGQLTLTIGKYYRVTGASTQNRGVTPDIPLPSVIDASVVGESARETALPWDEVHTTKFEPGQPLDRIVATLTASQLSRSKTDPDFQYLVEGIKDAEEIRSRKVVSLNLETRRAERETELNERLERENARRAALGLEPITDTEALEDLEEPDVQLDQAAAIVTDLAELRQLETLPTQKAARADQ